MTARMALVLSGGGSLGAVQVGFIRRAMELGIQFDILVGTSVGAMNASYVAFHAPGDHDCLEQIWHGLAGTRLFSRNPFTIAGSLWRSRLSLYDNRLLRRLLAEHLASDRFEDARAALYITATDICTGTRAIFREGSISTAVLASTAIPGVFPPVRIGDRLFVDGGVTSGGDIDVAIEAGATTVVYLDLRAPAPSGCPRNLLELVGRSFELLAQDRAACAVEHRTYPAEVVHIQPGLRSARGDFRDAPRLLASSYRVACEVFDRCRIGGVLRAGHYHGPFNEQAP